MSEEMLDKILNRIDTLAEKGEGTFHTLVVETAQLGVAYVTVGVLLSALLVFALVAIRRYAKKDLDSAVFFAVVASAVLGTAVAAAIVGGLSRMLAPTTHVLERIFNG